jgi:hypothetical protein
MKPAPQEAMNTASHFNSRCQVDLTGPFPLSSNKNKYLLVMIDTFSSYVECVPTPNKEAPTIYQTFLGGWVAQHFFCDRLNSDLGSEFHNGLFEELSAKVAFNHTFSMLKKHFNSQKKIYNRKQPMGIHVTGFKICTKFCTPCH